MTDNLEPNQLQSDTLIVSARVESFLEVFLGEQAWYPIRIDDRRKGELKWISVYQNAPVQAITHYAKILRIEKFKDTGKYRVVFDDPVELPNPVPLGVESGLSMQGKKYTTLARLLKANRISDLKPWNVNASY